MDVANCLASTSIGCLFCGYQCNPDRLRSAFTFLPPMVSYRVEDAVLASTPSKRWGSLTFNSEALESIPSYKRARENSKVKLLKTTREERIPLVWVRDSSIPEGQPSLVLLHCHGNATDIGLMMGTYAELSSCLRVEVAGLEYTGYGCSSGIPSSRDLCADVMAAYDFIIEQGVPPERIVAYGQSVGSGPAVDLASKRRLGGVILHSPMLSGIQVIDPHPDRSCRPSCVFKCFDFFPNDRLIQSVNCPTFIVHGLDDDVIPPAHGAKLHALTPKQHQWPIFNPSAAGHNDIIEKEGVQFFREVAHFLRGIRLAAKLEIKKPLGDEEDDPLEESVPEQLEMDRRVSPTDPSEILLVYKEPIVGPTNGMYAQFRRAAPASPS